MGNPLQSALNSKVGNYLQGRSVVNNVANPSSVYSMKQRQVASAAPQNAQSKALQRGITKTFTNTKGKTFGSPLTK